MQLAFLKRPSSCLIVLALSVLLSACGFKMRHHKPLPFPAVYTNITHQSPMGIAFYRLIKASSPHTLFVSTPEKANIVIQQLAFNRSMTEVSLDANGRVEEYELSLTLEFSVHDQQGNILMEPTILTASQLLPYDENISSAKSDEMQLIYQYLEKNLADKLYQRLQSDLLITRYYHFNPQ